MIGVGVGVRPRVSGGFDSSAQAFFDATGITGATQQQAINDLVVGLKADGLWSKMKALYPFVTDNRNLLSYTEDFGNASWVKTGGTTVTTNNILAPDGTLTADKVVFSGSNKEIYQGFSSAGNYVVSVYIKGTAGETIAFSDGVGIAGQVFTLDGTWQRIQFTTTASLQQCDINTYSGATARTIWLWGAQLEQGSTATTYQSIATTQQSFISNQFKYNLVNPVDSDAAFRLVFNGGWTFSSNGATPNGTNGYADTKLVPNSVLQLNNGHLSYYSRTNNTFDASEIGASQGGGQQSQIIINYTGFSYDSINNSPAGTLKTWSSDAMFLVSRTASNLYKSFRNNSIIASYTTASNTLPTLPIYIGARSGPVLIPTNRQCAFASIGNGLTDSEASNFYTRVQAYQTALSRQV